MTRGSVGPSQVGRLDDPFMPFEEARKLQAAIAHVRLVVLEGTSHQTDVGDWQSIASAINSFLDDGAGCVFEHDQPSSAFRTIFFTDLVGHTAMMSRLGDDAGRAVLREHEAITRTVLKQHGGTEVKTMGDGFNGGRHWTFDSLSDEAAGSKQRTRTGTRSSSPQATTSRRS